VRARSVDVVEAQALPAGLIMIIEAEMNTVSVEMKADVIMKEGCSEMTGTGTGEVLTGTGTETGGKIAPRVGRLHATTTVEIVEILFNPTTE